MYLFMKSYSNFICQQCGYVSSGQLGKCPECEGWGTFVETIVSTKDQKSRHRQGSGGQVKINKPLKISEIKMEKTVRITTGIGELDRVLGGGIVPGSVILLAGEPGVGKSTLLLTIAAKVGGLYVSGEESAEQIKIRAERLRIANKELRIMTETDVDYINEIIKEEKPGVVIIDSIQTMETEEMTGASGSVGQVRECALRFQKTAKKLGSALFIIGHVTKDGAIAGPKVLEHLVDTVLYFEGERYQNLRILRATKNRYGATDEVGIFEMRDSGMEEVKNPSEIFLGESASPKQEKIGSCIVCTLEGNRPLFVEIQALVVPTSIPVPRRIVSGVDYNRVQLICAIIQKYLRIPLYSSDVFVSTSGGIKITEPGADLGIVLAIASSYKNKVFSKKTCAIGELSLLGEIRRVNQLERRIKEAQKMGFNMIISKARYQTINQIARVIL